MKKPRPNGSINGSGAVAATAAADSSDGRALRFRASCVRSGDVVVLGMQVDARINCAGMALFRVFQGHVELLGFQPALGTYYSLYSPKWNNLMVIEGRTNENTRSEVTKQLLDAAYQAPFRDANKTLLALSEPSVVHVRPVEMDDEHAADALAEEMAEDFPIVLIFCAIPVTYGNVTCFYESNRSAEKDANTLVLPGFKIIVPKEDQLDLKAATGDADDSVVPSNPSELQYHDWKTPGRVLSELTYVDSFRTIKITRPWKSTVDAIETSLLTTGNPMQSIIVCGAKGVGKSTFCRYLVNRLLSHYGMVAFLDTDLGQSELTPPGLVSLHALVSPVLGPGFTHMKMPLRSFFCGGTNPSNDPLYYMQAVKSLLRLYEAKWGIHAGSNSNKKPHVPLVINTDGWIKSMGHDLLCSVIQEANPDHVVQLLATTKSKQFTVPSSGKWKIHGVEPWDPVGVTQPPRSSKDMRLYRWHQYFLSQSACDLARPQLQNLHVLSEKNRVDDHIARAYAGVTPFAVSFDQVDIGFAGSSVPSSQLLYSLNGSIVGLCINPRRPPVAKSTEEQRHADYEQDEGSGELPPPPPSEDTEEEQLDSEVDEGSAGLPPPQPVSEARAGPPRILVKPAHAPCLGVGLIRAVDVQRRLLFILSPLPLRVIERVNLLVRGNFPLASLVVDVNDPVQAPYVVTDVLTAEGTGAAAMQSRNNIKRKRDDKSSGGGK